MCWHGGMKKRDTKSSDRNRRKDGLVHLDALTTIRARYCRNKYSRPGGLIRVFPTVTDKMKVPWNVHHINGVRPEPPFEECNDRSSGSPALARLQVCSRPA